MLDLRPEMAKIGGYFQRELEANIRKQGGTKLDPQRFSLVKPGTGRARQSLIGANKRSVKLGRGIVPRTGKQRKSVATSVSLNRLYFTERFMNGAFRNAPGNEEVRVYCNPSNYPGESVTYADIVRYNNRGSSMVNRNITRPPKIFPLSDVEIQRMDAYKQARALLSTEGIKQKLFRTGLKKVVTVQL